MAKKPLPPKPDLLNFVKKTVEVEMFNFTRFVPECDDPLPPEEASPRDPDRIKWYYKKTVKEATGYLVSELKRVQTHFEDELFEDNGAWKRKWMISGPKKNKEKYDKINRMFDRTKLNEIMTYVSNITTYKETERIQGLELTKGKWYREEVEDTTGKKVKRELILFQIDYVNAVDKLGIDEFVIRRYMPHIAESTLIEYICGGSGTGQKSIYAYGTWVHNKETDMHTKKQFVSKIKMDYWLDKLSEFTAT